MLKTRNKTGLAFLQEQSRNGSSSGGNSTHNNDVQIAYGEIEGEGALYNSCGLRRKQENKV